jgi:NAD(P)-dependent dehydrogenase (short-subunit alcohol dehydrogenase family)
MMGRLQDKTAVVTGGTSGIGLATATLFINEGAKVIVTGQDRDRVEQTVGQLGSTAIGIEADQTSLADLDNLAAEVKKFFGKLDILFLNAGVTLPAATIDEYESHFETQVAINLKGPFFITQKLAPLMAEGASIVANTTCLDQMGMPGMAVYSATKAGLRSLVRTWAAEFLDRKIRVNAIAPGPINTPIYNKLGLPPEALQAMATDLQAKVPMRRFGNPDEIAKAVLFLASDDSSFMLGEELVVDGGWANL